MDTAVALHNCVENKRSLSDEDIMDMLNKSNMEAKLTADYMEHLLFAVFRIVCLTGIPHVDKLPYTQRLLGYRNQTIATEEGFSCLGGIKELMPCYNAMVLEAYSRLGLSAGLEA